MTTTSVFKSPRRIHCVPDPRRTEIHRLVTLVTMFVITPTVLLSSVGVVVLVLGSAVQDYVFGVLILGSVFTIIAGIAATLAYIKREASLAKLQTDFVAKVSHDLRTPLTSIRMFVETMQLGRVIEAKVQQQCLDVLSAETARLSMMIDQLLGWARMEAGKRLYMPERCEVASLIEAAVVAFQPQRITHPVDLELCVPDPIPAVLVDRGAMVEVIIHLLHNAHRYTGEVKRIRVRCEKGARANTVAICVDDNGPGIAKREQLRIFEKFYRGEDPLKRNLAGTGLGLAIVKHIVSGNGGTVSVDSEIGRGSSFRILLPAIV